MNALGSATSQAPRVLVLNASYEPMRIVSWQRAMLLLLGEKVDVLEASDIVIRSPSVSISLPSVIKMRTYYKPKRGPSKVLRFSRLHVFLRDDFRCQYCRETFPIKALTLDHVIPVVRGGLKTWTNIVSCCVDCNQKKGSRTPQEAGFHHFRTPSEPSVGFLPDILYLKGSIPDSWKAYLLWHSKTA